MTKPKPIKFPFNKCRQCGHKWIPRSNATVCPKCHSYRWRTAKPASTGRPRGSVKNTTVFGGIIEDKSR